MAMFQYMNDTALFNIRRGTAPKHPLHSDRARFHDEQKRSEQKSYF
jgi:hypothetical protein